MLTLGVLILAALAVAVIVLALFGGEKADPSKVDTTVKGDAKEIDSDPKAHLPKGAKDR